MSIVPTDVLEHQTCACSTVVFLSWRSYLHLGSDMSSLCDRERKADHLKKKKKVKICISKFHQPWLRVIKQIKHCMCVFLCFFFLIQNSQDAFHLREICSNYFVLKLKCVVLHSESSDFF